MGNVNSNPHGHVLSETEFVYEFEKMFIPCVRSGFRVSPLKIMNVEIAQYNILDDIFIVGVDKQFFLPYGELQRFQRRKRSSEKFVVNVMDTQNVFAVIRVF